jgi:hypothetical protein
MSQLLERGRTGPRHGAAPRKPVPVLEYTLLAVGVLLALFGVYVWYAPTDWVLGDLTEGWYLGSLALGGLFLSGGLSLFADRMQVDERNPTGLAVAGAVLSIAAFAAAVAFAAIWVL